MRPSTIAQLPPRKLTQPAQRWSPFGLSRYWADALLTFRRPRISCSSPSSTGRGVIGGAAHAGSAVPASAAPQRVLPIKLRREMDFFFEWSLTGVLRGCGGTIRGLPDDQNNLLRDALFLALPSFPLQRGHADRCLRPDSAKRGCPSTKIRAAILPLLPACAVRGRRCDCLCSACSPSGGDRGWMVGAARDRVALRPAPRLLGNWSTARERRRRCSRAAHRARQLCLRRFWRNRRR